MAFLAFSMLHIHKKTHTLDYKFNLILQPLVTKKPKILAHYTVAVWTQKAFFPLLIRPQGPQGCQKMGQDPLNMPVEVWCAKIAPKLKNI